jgi:hypothetical protein
VEKTAPGGNATGFIQYDYGLSGKFVDKIFKDAKPGELLMGRIALLCCNVFRRDWHQRRGRRACPHWGAAGFRSPSCRDPRAVFGPRCRRFSAMVLACAVKTEEAATKGGNYK